MVHVKHGSPGAFALAILIAAAARAEAAWEPTKSVELVVPAGEAGFLAKR